MLAAVKFNDQHLLSAKKINDIGPKRNLADKFVAVQPAASQLAPKPVFRFCISGLQYASALRGDFLSFRRIGGHAPSPGRCAATLSPLGRGSCRALSTSILIAVPCPQAVADAGGDSQKLRQFADIERAFLGQRNSITSVTRPGLGDMTTMRVDR